MKKRKSKSVKKPKRSSTVLVSIPVEHLSILECGVHDAADLHVRLADESRHSDDKDRISADELRRSARILRSLGRKLYKAMGTGGVKK